MRQDMNKVCCATICGDFKPLMIVEMLKLVVRTNRASGI